MVGQRIRGDVWLKRRTDSTILLLKCDDIMTKIGVIFYSYSGKTRDLAESIAAGTDADLIEVRPKKAYTSLSVVPVGCYRALKGGRDPIIPEMIDVSGYDLVIIGSPVWAGKPTPVINGAIGALTGSSGKTACLFVTCGAQVSGEEAAGVFRTRLQEAGLRVPGEAVFDKKGVQDKKLLESFVSVIKSASGGE